MFVAVLKSDEKNKWGDLVLKGREFSAKHYDGMIRVQFSCEDLILTRDEFDIRFEKFSCENSPLAKIKEKFPIGLEVHGVNKGEIPPLPEHFRVRFYGNVSDDFYKSSDRAIAILDDNAVTAIEFSISRLYWGGTRPDDQDYGGGGHGHGDIREE
jgi:hypothetical protein